MNFFKDLFQPKNNEDFRRPTKDFDFSLGHPHFYEFKDSIILAKNTDKMTTAFYAVLSYAESENWNGYFHLISTLAQDNNLVSFIIMFHKAKPEHWFSNLLLGLCLRNIGDEERDGAYLDNLSNKQFNIYFESLEGSKIYLEKALQLNPDCWMACDELMNYHSAMGDDFKIIEDYYYKSIQIQPKNVWSRVIFYDALLPKWSGFDWEISVQYLEQQLNDETIPLNCFLLLDYVVEYGINFFEPNSKEDEAWAVSDEVKTICLQTAKKLLTINPKVEPWLYIKTCNRLLFIATYADFDEIPPDILTIAQQLKPFEYSRGMWSEYDYTFDEIHATIKNIQNGIVP